MIMSWMTVSLGGNSVVRWWWTSHLLYWFCRRTSFSISGEIILSKWRNFLKHHATKRVCLCCNGTSKVWMSIPLKKSKKAKANLGSLSAWSPNEKYVHKVLHILRKTVWTLFPQSHHLKLISQKISCLLLELGYIFIHILDVYISPSNSCGLAMKNNHIRRIKDKKEMGKRPALTV